MSPGAAAGDGQIAQRRSAAVDLQLAITHLERACGQSPTAGERRLIERAWRDAVHAWCTTARRLSAGHGAARSGARP